jgi:hypothetical protein
MNRIAGDRKPALKNFDFQHAAAVNEVNMNETQ